MSGRVSRFVAAMILLGIIIPRTGHAQTATPPADGGVRWAHSSQADPLEISGLVINVETGLGLEGAQVYLPNAAVGALTDAQGRFLFRAPSPGTHELLVELIGYGRASSELTLADTEGVLLQAGLWPEPTELCDVYAGRPTPSAEVHGRESGVRVEVRALDTGLAPEAEVTLTVWANERGDSVTRVPPHADSLYWTGPRRTLADGRLITDSVLRTLPTKIFAGGALGVEGPFAVAISAPGYSTWRTSGVFLTQRNCEQKVSPLLRAWLLPT